MYVVSRPIGVVVFLEGHLTIELPSIGARRTDHV